MKNLVLIAVIGFFSVSTIGFAQVDKKGLHKNGKYQGQCPDFKVDRHPSKGLKAKKKSEPKIVVSNHKTCTLYVGDQEFSCSGIDNGKACDNLKEKVQKDLNLALNKSCMSEAAAAEVVHKSGCK